MRALIDIEGQAFGRWRVLSHDEGHKWRCQCQCGQIRSVDGRTLRNGRSKGCAKCHTKHKRQRELQR